MRQRMQQKMTQRKRKAEETLVKREENRTPLQTLQKKAVMLLKKHASWQKTQTNGVRTASH